MMVSIDQRRLGLSVHRNGGTARGQVSWDQRREGSGRRRTGAGRRWGRRAASNFWIPFVHVARLP